jgi:hypothetical protein
MVPAKITDDLNDTGSNLSVDRRSQSDGVSNFLADLAGIRQK